MSARSASSRWPRGGRPRTSPTPSAALALTEAATRLADRPDAVPDEVWEEATRHYDEQELAGLVLSIASINAWNRLNAVTKQITGEWVGQYLDTGESAALAT